MIKKGTVLFFLCLGVGLFSSFSWPGRPGPVPEDFNLLVVTIDTLRPDRLGCYGAKAGSTPQIDALAALGVLFERAFAHDPLTLPSHTNIFLGLTSSAHGVKENGHSYVNAAYLTLAELLKQQGYATGAFVSAFPLDSRFGLDQGFDLYDDRFPARVAPGFEFSERIAEKTVAAAVDWLSRPKSKWFCWVHLWDPHLPYAPPEPYASRFASDLYAGEVAYVDACLGPLFEAAEQRSGPGRTLILLTGDHGESLGEHGEFAHGYFAYNTTIHIPLILSGPGIKPSRNSANVGHVDIYPTLCDLLGIEKRPPLHGNSLTPLLAGKSRKAGPLFFEAMDANVNRGWAPLRGIIDGGHKFIESPIPELYDLEKDFGEKTNLAAAVDLAPLRKKLADLEKIQAAAGKGGGSRIPGRETRDRLQSLGYVVSPSAPGKKTYGPGDDLKTLLPLEQNLGLARSLAKDGRVAESVRLLEDVTKARPDFISAYDTLSKIYLTRGLTDEALAVLERGQKSNPEHYGFISAYGIALARAGRSEPAVGILQRALGIYEQDPEVWNSLGMVSLRLGNIDEAQQHVERALSMDPSDPVYNENLGVVHVTRALKTKNREEIPKAIASFEASVAADPALASAHNGLGGAYNLAGRKDEAVAAWKKAVAIDPAFDYPLYNLALAYLDKGDKDKALEYCRKYLDVKGTRLTPEERREIDSLIERIKK